MMEVVQQGKLVSLLFYFNLSYSFIVHFIWPYFLIRMMWANLRDRDGGRRGVGGGGRKRQATRGRQREKETGDEGADKDEAGDKGVDKEEARDNRVDKE